MPAQTTLLFILLGLFVISAFFSGSEAALIAMNKVRLRHLMEKKKPGARRVYSLIARMDKLIATILVGNNLVNTAIAAIATIIFTEIFGPGKGVLISTVVVTILLVIFSELVPKTFATSHPIAFAFAVRHLVAFFIWAFNPVTNFLTLVSNGFIRLLGGNPHFRSPIATEEEIKMMITIGKEEGYYGDEEKKMLERIFHFDEVEVEDVMTPLEEIVMVPLDIEPEELERVIQEDGHNRIPVYKDTRENIIGILYVRDLLYMLKNHSLIRLQDLISAPYFVPPERKGSILLRVFQIKKIQIAIVRDPKTEKALGLVTLEDLIEEIVGEIEEVEPTAKTKL